MKPEELRIALFSGNYNYVRDGANQALNRLVGYLLRQGAQVRVYSPTVEQPAFPPTGRSGQRAVGAGSRPARISAGIWLPARVRRDLADFDPNVFHCRRAGYRRASRRHLGAGGGKFRSCRRSTRGSTPTSNIMVCSSSSRRPRDHAPLLSALRCDRRSGRIHRGDHARAADEQGHLDLGARGRSRAVQSRDAAASNGAARMASPTTKWSSSSLAGWCWKRDSTCFPTRSMRLAPRACR